MVVILAFTELRELSTLEDEFEMLSELAFIAASAPSILDEEFERLTLEV